MQLRALQASFPSQRLRNKDWLGVGEGTVVPAATMGVARPSQVPRRWFRHVIPLAIFMLLLFYLCARSLREWSHLLWEESRSLGPKTGFLPLTALPCLSPGALSGCGSKAQSCIHEGLLPLQVCSGQGRAGTGCSMWDPKLGEAESGRGSREGWVLLPDPSPA